ncbi:MAG: LA2681 family HEPN domain-containing protein [Chitinophagales bacterium]
MESKLFNKLDGLLNEEKFDEARALIGESFKNVSFDAGPESLLLILKLYGFLTDIGNESQNEKDLCDSIDFYEKHEELIQNCITKASYYYDLANAKQGLSKIFYTNNKGVHPISITKIHFQEPIKLYWLAYKNIEDKNEDLFLQILINLSNSLITANRIVEGLQFLDIVLRTIPGFPQALISRGDSLDYLSKVTNCAVTISLYAQIYQSYNDGIRTNTLPPSILLRSAQNREQALNTIEENGFRAEQIEEEIQESQKEFENHTDFRKYCIYYFLTLNEHGIYCNCVATKKDDLQIGVKNAMFKGDIIPQLELLLNRIKSEFALARWLYYQSLQPRSPVEEDTMFTELLDGEVINSQTELQRTSFRLCYGLLDKIALGICKLYNLDSKRIHFEIFWEDKKRNEQLNLIRNIHLNALYSIASDLNTKTGELKQFKNWRNDLEHNLLVLKDTSKIDLDILKLFKDRNFVEVADAEDFTSKTLHLLQLTRAAIFSFVYCVRLETIHEKNDNQKKNRFMMGFKRIKN